MNSNRSPTDRRHGSSPYRTSRTPLFGDRDNWKQWPSVRVTLSQLPSGTTTWEIFRNLARYGKIDYIRIDETRQGNFARRATVVFKPPPRTAIWEPVNRGGIPFVIKRRQHDPVANKFDDVEHKNLFALLDPKQTSRESILSPVRPGVKYSPEIILPGDSIDFGYLVNERLMAVLASRNVQATPNSVQAILKLDRRELEIRFPVNLTSKGASAVRSYRFFVALDDQFALCDTFDGMTTSLILHVKNPPWYSKQLKQAMELSHDTKLGKWSAENTWLRQTDIVDHKEYYAKIDEKPVSLQKEMNSINIARWTTFRFNVKSENYKRSPVLQEFMDALKDFNIKVISNPNLMVQRSSHIDAPIWNLVSSTVRLPFEVRYQLEVCISAGWLNEYLIDMEFLKRLEGMQTRRAKQMLIHLDSHQTRIYSPMDIFDDIRFHKPVKARTMPSNCEELLNATVTATGLILHTPSVEVTNRIIRKYRSCADRFLRVRFEDDSYRGKSRLFPATNNKMMLVFKRVLRTMKRGIIVAGRHYEFLAWGNSQLREHGAYFFAPTADLTADNIRENMGMFDQEKIVAKRAARMGQCFSTTKPITSVGARRQWRKNPVPDVKNNGYNFTDGVSKISYLAAQLVAVELGLDESLPPSAFQFRLGGCKGVLAIDMSLKNLDIAIRPSQFKFDSESDELEIIRVSQYWQSFLNRQLILVLSDLGISDKVFLQKQEQCIVLLDQALTDDNAALRSLRDNVDPNQITLSIANLIEAGFRQVMDPFVLSLLELYRAWTLKYLKEKAKIPISKGAFVLGVADETGKLQGHDEAKIQHARTYKEKVASLPEIFIQYTNHHTGLPTVVEGLCIIARNPSLHRGDIRVVRAVNYKELHHLRDVLVLPINGDRDLSSMCSGGDLDGDDYIICWDPDLVPSEAHWNAEPFHYTAPTPVSKDHITTDDIIDFFCAYLQNDFLGRIAHAHIAAADFLDNGIESEQCLELVNLHSKAVDYPKTGVPANMPPELERDSWPHFMEKKGRRQYKSRKVLGRLFDAVERVKFRPKLTDAFDRRILVNKVPAEMMTTVSILKKQYDESMRRIMAQHEIRTEFEVWSTFVLDHSKSARDFKFHEEIGQHARTLKESYYESFCAEAGSREFEALAPLAVAAYRLTYEEVKMALAREALKDDSDSSKSSARSESVPWSSSSHGNSNGSEPVAMPMISFPWVLQDVLCKIATDAPLEAFAGDGTVDCRKSVRQHLPDPAPQNIAEQPSETPKQVEVNGGGETRGDDKKASTPSRSPSPSPGNIASPLASTEEATDSEPRHMQDPAMMKPAQKIAAGIADLLLEDDDEVFEY